jgi:hypothetical protein
VTSPEFESELFKRIIITRPDGGFISTVNTYADLKELAKDLQKEDVWKGTFLKFSDTWCHDFLRRHQLSRHRITRADKKRPTVQEVRTHMSKVQDFIKRNDISPSMIVNMDETSCVYNQSLKYTYSTSRSGMRASGPTAKDKEKFTAAISVTEDGALLPTMMLIKCSSKVKTQSNVRVLKNLNLPDADWTQDIFQIPGTDEARKYLINKSTGDLIGCNGKAWMESGSMCLWVEKVFHLGPQSSNPINHLSFWIIVLCIELIWALTF